MSRISLRARALYVVLIVALLVGLAPLQPTGSRQAASADGTGDIAYIYDELGRLIAVVDPDYETAVYSYDETGNILSIARQLSTAVSLIEFAPDWGSVANTEVTIYGTGFGTAPGDNSVSFNGTIATSVTPVSTTTLKARVPSGATTGPITVTTPTGPATSSTSFTVTVETPPTITNVSANIAKPGDAFTITGANYEARFANNIVAFNTARADVTTKTATSIVTTVPPAATSGRVTVSNTGGTAVSSTDVFVPPVTPANWQPSDIDQTARISVGDSPYQLNVAPSFGHIGLVIFDGQIDQHVMLRLSTHTYAGATSVKVFTPRGIQLVAASRTGATSGQYLDLGRLPEAGTYAIAIDPTDTSTGSVTLALSEIVDSTGTIGNGQSILLTLDVVGEDGLLSFEGTAGQAVTVSTHTPQPTIYQATLTILARDGTILAGPATAGSLGSSANTLSTTLPETATYMILVEQAVKPVGSTFHTGNITVRLDSTSAFSSAPSLASSMVAPSADAQASAPTATDDSGRMLAATPAEQGTKPTEEITDDDFIPGADQFGGVWESDQAEPFWTALPGLVAAPGITALAGQVLTLSGNPLPGTTVELDGVVTQTDDTGRFLLTGISAGRGVLHVDGNAAGTPGKQYGTYDIGVKIVDGTTTALGYTIWLTKLSNARKVKLKQQPTTEDIVVTTPHIPGLELHIPAGSTIEDANGNPVEEIAITPIPIDRSPFPLPANTYVPVYFTVQPGGAIVLPEGAWLIYPNYGDEAPGTRLNFWTYDPLDEGWHIYGQGTVTADGTQVVPDEGVRIYEFAGAMIGNLGFPPITFPSLGGATGGDPVDLASGLFVMQKTDLVLPDVMPIEVTRVYRPGDEQLRSFGMGMSNPYDMFLYNPNFSPTDPYGEGNDTYREVDLILPDGARVQYINTATSTNIYDAFMVHTATPSIFFGSTLEHFEPQAPAQPYWQVTLTNGMAYEFPQTASVPGKVQAIRDRNGNEITILRADGGLGNITSVRSPNGRSLRFTYVNNRVSTVIDNSNRTITYGYDTEGRLTSVTDSMAYVTTYAWTGTGPTSRMWKITDNRAITYLENEYDTQGRVYRQYIKPSDRTQYFEFTYTTDTNGKITQTDVRDPRGNIRRVTFNAAGYTLTDTYGLGSPVEQTITYVRQADSSLVETVTDDLGRVTRYTYDPATDPLEQTANILSVTDLDGTSQATTTSFTYVPDLNVVKTITDPLNRTTTFYYDTRGNLLESRDALGNKSTLTYNEDGQPVTVTDALGNTVVLDYTLGDLTATTDPLGNQSRQFVDAGGRAVVKFDPLGNVTESEYSRANLPTKIIDAHGEQTLPTWDKNGNLKTLTDARGGVTTYVYDGYDLLESRTDPLGNIETFDVDGNGNLTSRTDRRGYVANYTYDELDRLDTVVLPSNSTITYDYTWFDAYDPATPGERRVTVTDTIGGTVTLRYDDLDRLTSETTTRGTVSYGYDASSRQTSMTVAGQTPVVYGYDAADRLLSVTQGTKSVGITYDAANRRDTLRLTNDTLLDYAYDAASRLTGITYARNGTTLGDLTYDHDAAGQRVAMGGSFGRTGLPAATTGTRTFNALNQLTQDGTTTLTYDLNGNLTNDGTRTYTWNRRNELASIQAGGVTTASFLYDPAGRRRRTTIDGVTLNYLYDGANVVQELNGTTSRATFLTGLGIDETFARTVSSTGTTNAFLTDGLGSTLALGNSSGTLTTAYTYDPFGAVTATGSANPNTLQYTGRENDGTGLQYNRARYYSPSLGRFISEDPIGFGGGDVNLYAYVGNSPINYTDPMGTCGVDAVFDVAFIAYDIYQIAANGRKGLASNLIFLGADIAGLALPCFSGGGTILRGSRFFDNGMLALPPASKNLPQHHIFPRQWMQDFARRGLDNIDDYTMTLPDQVHRRIHPEWNREWGRWLDANPGAEAADLFQKAGDMIHSFDIDGRSIQPFQRR